MDAQLRGRTYTRAVPALLTADHLTVRYPGGVTALEDLDVEVPDSGITCLLGANGAGKTTLVETAAGLVTASAGTVRVRGGEPGALDNRLELGVMLQDGGLPGSARPREFLEYLARLYPSPRDVRSLLDLVEIDPGTRSPLRRLSGGQQRRVAWAAAMVGNPRSLFLDEPTSSIDPVGRARLYEVLRAERDRGVSMIVSTHLIEDVESLADFIVVMHGGRVVLTGSPDELRPLNTVVVRSPRAMDEVALLSALPPGSACVRTGPDAYQVTVPTVVDAAVMATVSSWCTQHAVSPDLSVGDLGTVLWSALRGDTT